MIRLRLKNKQHSNKDDFLAIPDAQPITLHEVRSDNLPYACQCPLCGGIFEIPTGILYEISDDTYEDKESDVDTLGPNNSDIESGFFNEPDLEQTVTEEIPNTQQVNEE